MSNQRYHSHLLQLLVCLKFYKRTVLVRNRRSILLNVLAVQIWSGCTSFTICLLLILSQTSTPKIKKEFMVQYVTVHNNSSGSNCHLLIIKKFGSLHGHRQIDTHSFVRLFLCACTIYTLVLVAYMYFFLLLCPTMHGLILKRACIIFIIRQYNGDTHNTRALTYMNTHVQILSLGESSKSRPALHQD